MHRGRLRGFETGTAISWPQSRGTFPHPKRRAAAAGNSAVRSGVVVNQTAAMSPAVSAFSRASCASSSVVASTIAVSLSSSVVVAPRIPRTAILVCLLGAPSSLSFWEEAGKREVAGGAELAHPEPVPCRPEVGVKVKARELNPPRHVPHILKKSPGLARANRNLPRYPSRAAPRPLEEASMRSLRIRMGIVPAVAALW